MRQTWSWVSGIVAMAVLLPSSAAAAPTRIYPAEMRPTAVKVATGECQRRTYMKVRGVPIKVYECIKVHVACAWHPPLKPNVGYCDMNIRVASARPSFLADIECSKRLFFFKRRKGEVFPINMRSRWACYEADPSPTGPEMKRWVAALMR